MQVKKSFFAAMLAVCYLLTACNQVDEVEVEQPKVDDVKVSSAHFGLSYYETGVTNPVLDDSDLNQLVYEAMYEGLFEVGSSFTAVPVLCDTYTVDGTRFVFHLKPGVTFWDGSALTADDVVNSLKAAWENEASPYYARMRQVQRIEAKGSEQVAVTLSSTNVNFPRLLNVPIYRAQTTQGGFYLGTGPFVPEKDGIALRLLANKNWHKGYLGAIRTIELVAVSHVDAALSGFRAGDISVIRAMRIVRDPVVLSGAVDTVQMASANLHYLGINHGQIKMQNKELRQAISFALNRKNICDVQLQTFANPAVLPVNPQPSADTVVYSLEADMPKAMELLGVQGTVTSAQNTPSQNEEDYDEDEDYDDYGYNALRFIVNESNPFKVAAAQQISSTLNTVGLEVNFVKLSDEEYTDALRNGSFDLYYGEVRMTPDFDLRGLIGTNGVLNYGKYQNAQMDSAIYAALAGEDTKALYGLLLDEMPIVPIAFLRQQMVVRKGLFTVFDPAPYNMFASVENWESE